MKKIKLFFIRNYQRLLRFFILFSIVACIAFSSLVANAETPVTWNVNFSKPDITNSSCYLEVVTYNGWILGIYVDCFTLSQQNLDLGFYATVVGDRLYIDVYNHYQEYSGNALSFYGVYYNGLGSDSGSLDTDDRTGFDGVSFYLGNAGSILGIRGYNCDTSSISSGYSFVFAYGSDSIFIDKLNTISSVIEQFRSTSASQLLTIIDYIAKIQTNNRQQLDTINSTINSLKSQNKAQLDEILQAIRDNKSSAEKNEYSATTPSQKQNQADLDSAEASINADTAEARTSTINIFKNFTLPSDIMKGMLSVTKIFNAMCNCIPFAPIILNFSLAVGAAAFLLGLSAWTIGKLGGRNK